MTLPDFLKPSLDVVFCGTAAGTESASRGHYYARPNNRFWTVLHSVGFTSERLRQHEDYRLTEFGIGLTDLVKLHSGNDVALRSGMYDVPGFICKIETCTPRFVAFNGKRAAATFLGLCTTACVAYGALERTIGRTRLFVLPSTSGSANGAWDIQHWHSLAELIAQR
jgi:TDG/mug DNA glycosylase family protein